MHYFAPDELSVLAERPEPLKVSLLMSVDPVAEGWRADPIRWKNLIAQARERLVAAGLRGPVADVWLAPAAELLEDLDFWRQGGRGVAAYLAPGFQRFYRVPLALREEVVLGDNFLLRPLLRMLHGDGTYYVLAVSPHQHRLLQCTHSSVRRVPLSGVPIDLAESSATIEHTSPPAKQAHAVNPIGGLPGRAGSVPRMYRHAMSLEDRTRHELTDYYAAIARGLEQVLGNESSPLVYAGESRHRSLFGESVRYSHLLDGGLYGNPDFDTDAELRDRAWAMVEPVFLEARHLDASRYLHRRAGEIVSNDLAFVLPAAMNGRVDTLFLPDDAPMFGHFDVSAQRVELHAEREPGDTDLLNEAAIWALRTGAHVYAVPAKALPSAQDPVNAILRW